MRNKNKEQPEHMPYEDLVPTKKLPPGVPYGWETADGLPPDPPEGHNTVIFSQQKEQEGQGFNPTLFPKGQETHSTSSIDDGGYKVYTSNSRFEERANDLFTELNDFNEDPGNQS